MKLNKKLNLKLKNHMDLITDWIVEKDVIKLKFTSDYNARIVWDFLLSSKVFKTSMTINRILFVKEVK